MNGVLVSDIDVFLEMQHCFVIHMCWRVLLIYIVFRILYLKANDVKEVSKSRKNKKNCGEISGVFLHHQVITHLLTTLQ